MNKTILIVIVIAVILIIGGIYLLIPKSGTNSNNQLTPPAVPGTVNTGGNTGGSTSPQTHTINIQGLKFGPTNPGSLTINAGDTVVWTNMDSVGHTVTSDSGSELASPTITTGKTYSHTFTTAGTFNYHCSIHPMMKASITVQ